MHREGGVEEGQEGLFLVRPMRFRLVERKGCATSLVLTVCVDRRKRALGSYTKARRKSPEMNDCCSALRAPIWLTLLLPGPYVVQQDYIINFRQQVVSQFWPKFARRFTLLEIPPPALP